jgi:isoleucyl-tRNA synthetase
LPATTRSYIAPTRLFRFLQARDINLDIKRVVAYRYWCNKLWNAIKFAMMNLPAGFQPLPQQQLAQQMPSWPAAARWVLSRLNSAVETINKVKGVRLHPDCWAFASDVKVLCLDECRSSRTAAVAAASCSLVLSCCLHSTIKHVSVPSVFCVHKCVPLSASLPCAAAQAMEAYDFSTATQTAYAWWQYELCDVFIELMKPVMARDEAADPGV